MTAYLMDSNVFIQAKNLHYGFDFCPAFWDWLVEQSGTGNVASIEKVADELQAGDDELAEWAAARGGAFFLRPDDTVLPALRAVSDWASGQRISAGRRRNLSCRLQTIGLSRTRWLTGASLSRTKSPPTPPVRSRFQMPASASACVA